MTDLKSGLARLALCGIASSTQADPTDLAFIDTFKTHDTQSWSVAEYDFSHPHFNTDWKKANAVFGTKSQSGANGLTLHLAPQTENSSTGNTFSGASVHRTSVTHYGRYEAWIKPAKGSGLVTGFFTYTGAHYGTQHDEIDIEFLGKNTRQIHIAWFQDGNLNNKFIDLPFDAADKPRLYAFEWAHDRIDWYVEDSVIYTAFHSESPLPQTPSLLFANLWAADPTISVWSGHTTADQSGSAWFSSVKFTPFTATVIADKRVSSMKTKTKEPGPLVLHE